MGIRSAIKKVVIGSVLKVLQTVNRKAVQLEVALGPSAALAAKRRRQAEEDARRPNYWCSMFEEFGGQGSRVVSTTPSASTASTPMSAPEPVVEQENTAPEPWPEDSVENPVPHPWPADAFVERVSTEVVQDGWSNPAYGDGDEVFVNVPKASPFADGIRTLQATVTRAWFDTSLGRMYGVSYGPNSPTCEPGESRPVTFQERCLSLAEERATKTTPKFGLTNIVGVRLLKTNGDRCVLLARVESMHVGLVGWVYEIKYLSRPASVILAREQAPESDLESGLDSFPAGAPMPKYAVDSIVYGYIVEGVSNAPMRQMKVTGRVYNPDPDHKGSWVYSVVLVRPLKNHETTHSPKLERSLSATPE
jgi:hypothetical protein